MKTSVITLISAIFLASSVVAAPAAVPNYRVEKCTQPGVVAWTFDDGPGPYNDRLLKILKDRNIKATFFMLGNMIDANPTQAASLKKVLADGHMLASHTYTHEKSLTAMTAAELTSEITRTSDTMFKHSGVKPAYVRAPRGECDQQCINRLTAMNLVVSHWNCDTNDWRQMDMAKKNPQQAATVSMEEPTKSIINGSNPATDSFILLQHEIHEFSVDILANMVAEAITKKGYRFVTMEECIGVPAYLDGSTVPPPTTPPTVTSPAVVPPPVGATTAPGAVVPTASVGTPQVTVQPPKPSGNSTAGAGIVKAGAWAMGLAAAVGYAFL